VKKDKKGRGVVSRKGYPTDGSKVGGEKLVEPAFEPETSVFRGTSFMGFGRDFSPARVDVKNGKVVRIRPLHYEDEGYGPDYLKPWKIEVRGKVLQPPTKTLITPLAVSYKKRIYSPNRIKYPLIRTDWDPKGERNTQNRGKSKYRRISWDEATDIIASEILRIQKKYGHFAVLVQGDGHGEGKVVHGPHGCQTQLLRHMGPDTQSSYTMQLRTTDSWEGWYWGGKHFNGWETTGTRSPANNMTTDMAQNCELMLHMTDRETTVGMSTSTWVANIYFWLSEVGIENVYITPELCYGGAVHGDKWIPVLPCQDGPLFLAIAYTWIKEDTYDKEYIATHSVGFNKFKAYVTGKEDGVPKTPQWASPKCGVPPWTIKAIARNWAKKRTSIEGYMGPGMRGPYSSEPCRFNAFCEGMQGYGAPGRNRYDPGHAPGLPGPKYRITFDRTPPGGPAPARGLEEYEAPRDNFRTRQFIPKTRIHDAIIDPPITWRGTASPWMESADQAREFTYPIPKEQGGTEIHMIWTDTPCWMVCWNGGNRYIQAMRDPKIEFILTEHPWLEDDTLMSDIILPTTTRYEEYDICAAASGEGLQNVFVCQKAVEPIGEAKTAWEVSLEVAEKLEKMGCTGLVEKYTQGRSVEDWMKYGWDVQECGEKSGMTWEQFKEGALYTTPWDPDWEKKLQEKPGARGFYEDPKANPLQTPTGLLEYESTFLKKHFPDDKERQPVPHWIEGGPGWSHNESPESERAKKYPLICQSNHPRWRHHAQMDDCSWLREIPTCKVKGIDGYLYEPIWLHPTEAAKRGIVSGDIISMYNERGVVLGGAYVTERIRPGVAYQDHGARVDPIVMGPDEFIDRGGSNNLICPDRTLSLNAAGQVSSGFLVEVEKADIQALKAKYPEAFARPYDPGCGLIFDSWVEGGM
jgi:anaerobic selenocysteine-containing dehydrogenase